MGEKLRWEGKQGRVKATKVEESREQAIPHQLPPPPGLVKFAELVGALGISTPILKAKKCLVWVKMQLG